MLGLKRFRSGAIAGAVLAIGGIASTVAVAQDADDKPKPSPLASLPLRLIGPAYPSGRISDFAFSMSLPIS